MHNTIKKFTDFEQEHIFRFIDEISKTDKEEFNNSLDNIDLDRLNQLISLKDENKVQKFDWKKILPVSYIKYVKDKKKDFLWKKAKKLGVKAIKKNQVCAFTVAGGQGTRLGYDGPKGSFPISTVKKKSLFQIFSEKILATQKKYKATIKWYIMTSSLNIKETKAFFEENNYFGLKQKHIFFFQQGNLPAVDFKGKLILNSKKSVAMSPDGHGGTLKALKKSGALKQIRADGVKYISYFQVDNSLVNCIDPHFIGFHIMSQAEISSKAIEKKHPREKVGSFCSDNGIPKVIEYSDIPEKILEEEERSNTKKFNLGNIAIHIINTNFVKRLTSSKNTSQLPTHLARKKIPYIDKSGKLISPKKENGIKFETFIFDSIPLALGIAVLETSREEEFSPLKNAEGEDSIQSAKDDQNKLFAKWLIDAGEKIETNNAGLPKCNIEISPLFALNREQFIKKWKNKSLNKYYIQDDIYIS